MGMIFCAGRYGYYETSVAVHPEPVEGHSSAETILLGKIE